MKEEFFLNKIDRIKKNILKVIHDLEKFESEIKILKTERRIDQNILRKFEKEKQYSSKSQMIQRIEQYDNKIKMNKKFLDDFKLKLENLLKESQQQSKV